MLLRSIAVAAVLTGCASSPSAPDSTAAASEPSAEVGLASEAPWEQLNPARGDASPKAATLWGDRKGTSATGFLVRFVDGFESPPHIHNVSYRGVVVRGLVHNDDPKADAVWMPPGSFWTQPKGDVHITAAKGADTIAYIEIDEGPYLVRPVDAAFSSGETPVNMPATDIAWGPHSAVLWGDPNGDQPSGIFTKLPSGSTAILRGNGSTFRAVVIGGRVESTVAPTMEPGSYFSSEGSVRVSCAAGEACLIYVRTGGGFEVVAED